MKNILKKTFTVLLIVALLAVLFGCPTPSDPATENNTSSTTNDSSSSTQEPAENVVPPIEERIKPYKIEFETTQVYGYCNEPLTVRAVLGENCYKTDNYRIEIILREMPEENITATFKVTDDGLLLLTVTSTEEGRVGFYVHNETLQSYSAIYDRWGEIFYNAAENYILYIDFSKKTPVDELTTKPEQFIGTWKTSYSSGLIDTITFNSDGTGRYSNSNYASAGSDTFRWSIKDDWTLILYNSLGQSSQCMFNFVGQKLKLKNFLGLPQNTYIEFIHQ